jgi:hypothetical protein
MPYAASPAQVLAHPTRYTWLFVLAALVLASGVAFSKDGAYRPPRLGDGRPDLQGMWDYTDATPLVRPRGFDTLVITADQAAEIERRIDAVQEDRETPTEPTEYFNERRICPIRGELHSSIIVDPEDGRIPGTPLFQEWQSKVGWSVLNAMDGPEQRPTSERCLGNPASQAPHLYNPGTNLHQIVQTEDVILFVAEWMNEARIIRLHSTHVPAAVTSWSGDSIAWWEGDTLVVETKYFTASDTGRVAPGVNFKVSPRTTVVERITRVSNDELNYVFTVEDPTYYTRPWRGETHFMRTDDRMLEYACHEGNSSLTYILQGARVRDGQWPPATVSQ